MLDISILKCSYYSITLILIFYDKKLSPLVSLQDNMFKKNEKNKYIKNKFKT